MRIYVFNNFIVSQWQITLGVAYYRCSNNVTSVRDNLYWSRLFKSNRPITVPSSLMTWVSCDWANPSYGSLQWHSISILITGQSQLHPTFLCPVKQINRICLPEHVQIRSKDSVHPQCCHAAVSLLGSDMGGDGSSAGLTGSQPSDLGWDMCGKWSSTLLQRSGTGLWPCHGDRSHRWEPCCWIYLAWVILRKMRLWM